MEPGLPLQHGVGLPRGERVERSHEAGGSASGSAARVRVALWDLPLRLFHWAFAAAVVTAIGSAQVGGNWMTVHGWAGRIALGLIVFRIVWGFSGSTHARFASFWPRPSALVAYVQGRWRGLGHNPLGAVSVVLLLALPLLQALSGLYSNDDIAYAGPLAASVSEDLSSWFTGWHHRLGDALWILVGLHVAAIAFHAIVHRDDLVRPMLRGDKWVDPAQAATQREQRARPVGLALGLVLGAAAVVLSGGLPFGAA